MTLEEALMELLDERLQELEADDPLTSAEAWQREEVHRTWARLQSGENPESSWDEVDLLFTQGGFKPESAVG